MLTSEWTNVQAPVREMFMAITKSIKDQSNDMKKIISRMDNFVTHSDAKTNSYPRNDGKLLEKSKASIDIVRLLEEKLDDCQNQISKMSIVMQHQTTAITDLNFRLEKAHRIIAEKPIQSINESVNFDDIYDYIGHVESRIREDCEKQYLLKGKGNDEFNDTTFIINSIQQLQTQLDTIQEKINNVDSRNDAEMTHLRGDFSHLQEKLKTITSQFEKDINSIEISSKSFIKESLLQHCQIYGERIAASEQAIINVEKQVLKSIEENEKKRDSHVKSIFDEIQRNSPPPIKMHDVEKLLDRVLDMKSYGDMKANDVHNMIIENNQIMRGESEKTSTLLKRELYIQQIEEQKLWYEKFDSRLEKVTEVLDSAKRESNEEREKMRDLAADVTRSLNKKANQSDLRALINSNSKSDLFSSDDNDSDNEKNSNKKKKVKLKVHKNTFETNLQIKDLEDKIGDLTAEFMKMRKSVGLDASNIRSNVQDKIDRIEAEDLIAEVIGHAIGRKIPTSSPSSSSLSQSKKGSGSIGKYIWKDVLRDRDHGNDWKLALGDMGMNIRREVNEKLDRSECVATVLAETHGTTQTVDRLCQDIQRKADASSFAKVEHLVQVLHERVVSELTCGMWLWTSRQLVGGTEGGTADQVIPWDAEAVNAAPSSLLWRKGSTEITVKLPGLYRVGLAVFTTLPVALTVCLNGEPVLSLGPDTRPDRLSSFANAQGLREERYLLRRLRHSAGDVSGVSMDEPLSLPANAVISINYQSATASQAYLSLRKL